MLDFTISLKDDLIDFSPLEVKPDLALLLPPSARIGRSDDNVHLDPIPVHCFFNAIALGQWLATRNGLSISDGAAVYLLHDIMKSFLRFTTKRQWLHSLDLFDPLESVVKRCGLFDDFDRAFQTIRLHMNESLRRKAGLGWNEITWHEQHLGPRGEQREAESIGFAAKVNPTLSNTFAIEHIKQLFIRAYVEAVRLEYGGFFEKLDEITYCYDFVDPAKLSGDTARDIFKLCRDVTVTLENKQLVIHTPIGAVSPPERSPDANTHIRVPFWLLLTIYADPTGMIFPIPSLPDDSPNSLFVERVKNTFHRGIKKLLATVPSTGRHWAGKKADIISHLDETLTTVSGKYEDVRAALVARSSSSSECNLCGSKVSEHFLCSPELDLGWSASHYTDWHQGNIDSTCVLCAVSNFKIPPALERANRLVKQKKVVYLSVTTPNIASYSVRFDNTSRKSVLPFFDAELQPRLVISSLESLATLNLIGALFLHASIAASQVKGKSARELWLQPAVKTSPFSFVGEIGKRQSKREIIALLEAMHTALNRSVVLLDPMMKIDIEIPYDSLTCIMGNTQGKHYELKLKPLHVSNKTGTLPLVCDGYHLVDAATLGAMAQVQSLVRALRGKGVSDSMKISALATSPADLIEAMTSIGGCNIETSLNQIQALAGSEDLLVYLERIRTLVHKYPLVTELWR